MYRLAPVHPFWFGREAILGLAWAACCAGLGDALKRGASRVLATGLLASGSPSRVATHAQRDDFPTSSPMAISGLLGELHSLQVAYQYAAQACGRLLTDYVLELIITRKF